MGLIWCKHFQTSTKTRLIGDPFSLIFPSSVGPNDFQEGGEKLQGCASVARSSLELQYLIDRAAWLSVWQFMQLTLGSNEEKVFFELAKVAPRTMLSNTDSQVLDSAGCEKEGVLWFRICLPCHQPPPSHTPVLWQVCLAW